jgi:hypothetical protein
VYITKWWLPTSCDFQEVNSQGINICVIGHGIRNGVMSSISYHCLPSILLYNVTVQNVLKWSIYFAGSFINTIRRDIEALIHASKEVVDRPLPVLTQLPISTLTRREGGSQSLALLLCLQAPKGRHRVSKL